jgi:periplasmic protein TonB
MGLIGARRTEALAGRPPRRDPWRTRLAILISVLVHLAIGALLLVTVRRKNLSEMLPPPSPVTMVFDAGRKSGPTVPNPSLQATPSAPSTPEAPPQPVAPPQTPPAPTPPVPTPSAVPPVEPAPTPTPPAAEQPQTPPEQPPAEQAPSPPVQPPAEQAPSPPSVQIPMPPLPPPAEQAPLPPPPPPAEPTPTRPPSPTAKPLPPPRVRPPARMAEPHRPSDFPAPMDFSFGSPKLASPSPARPRSAPRIPGTIDMSLGPAAKGAADSSPFSEHDADAAGADWRNALSRWVSEHAYYPEQAVRDDAEGDAKVHVHADPDGRVREVELVGKSGSMWLDMALLALFRDQHIPPLPSGDHDPIDFDFTMHYVLIRPR